MTKLGNIISILDDKDRKTLLSLMMTPLCNGNQKHLDLFHLYTNQKPIKERGLDQQTRLTMSELFKMIEQYLIIKVALNDESYKRGSLLRLYREHENEKLFKSKIVNIVQPTASAEYKQMADQAFEKWQLDFVANRFSNTDVKNIIFNSDIAVISDKLKQTVTFASQSSLLSKSYEVGFFSVLEPYIVENNLLNIPCISIYYNIFKMISDPSSEKWFELFRKDLADHETDFDPEEVKSHYFHGINYCIRKFNTGAREYGDILLQFYRDGMDRGYMLTNGYLSRNTYRNINTVAIRLGRLQDASAISENYASLLREEDKMSAFHFNMGNIYYAKQNYDLALESLQKVDFDDHLSNLSTKVLLLKIYYETGQTRLLDSHLNAMQIYLFRQKIIGYHKANYTKIVKYTQKLMAINPYDKSAKQKLINKIKAEQSLPDKGWLVNQVEKL